MKIAYNSDAHFFEEGLKALEPLGCKIFTLKFEENQSFQEALDNSCPDADLVIVEIFGNNYVPTDIAYAKMPTIAYGIDSTINTYLYKHLFQLFDYVFVDQKNAANELSSQLLKTEYLPLCISEQHFREFNANPMHEITFIGRFSRSRKKRAHLIKMIEQNLSISIFEDVKSDEMQDILANSLMCLNENLFNGLNYRVLQSFAAGSLLLNEEGLYSVDDYFKANEHYIPYTPDNIINLINEIKENPAKYQEMAKNAQDLCRKYHTSTYRTKELFAAILSCSVEEVYPILENKIKNKEQVAKKIAENHTYNNIYKDSAPYYITFSQIMYDLNYVQVFGGHVTPIITRLLSLTQEKNVISFIAMPVLMRVFACTNQQKFFEDLYANASKLFPQLTHNINTDELIQLQHFPSYAHIDFACVSASYFILQNSLAEAEINISQIIPLLGKDFSFLPFSNDNNKANLNPEKQKEVELTFKIAQIYAAIGNIFELGFEKINNPPIPDTGLKAAWNAWLLSYNTDILDFILDKSKEFEVAGGLLDGFMVAYKQDFITDAQKEIIMKIAKDYYIELH